MKNENKSNLSIEEVRDYLATINLNDYELGGCEVGSDDDCELIIERFNKGEGTFEEVVDKFLCDVREILDEGIDDEEEDEYPDVDETNENYPYGYDCEDMREDTIKIFPSIGTVYYVTLQIPANLFSRDTQAAKEDFVDMWLGDNLKNVEEWEWKNPQF